jgi:cytochrome c oxidase subunit 1
MTTALDAVPDSRHEIPGESIWPLVMAIAVGVTFIGAVFRPRFYAIGFVLGVIAFAGWGWPRRADADPTQVVTSNSARRRRLRGRVSPDVAPDVARAPEAR